MKRVWKPLDVAGLRLYKVTRSFHKKDGTIQSDDLLVLGKRPQDASNILERIFKDAQWHPDIQEVTFTAGPVEVLMPKSWWEDGVPCGPLESG